MSPLEATSILLRRLGLDVSSAPENIRTSCTEVAELIGYLALAVDLAGAYIANDPIPEQALVQYLTDYPLHRDELLQLDGFKGPLPSEKTLWTIWDTTLQKLTNEYGHLHPGLLLTFLAHCKGAIIPDELFRITALGLKEFSTINQPPEEGEFEVGMLDCRKLFNDIPNNLRRFFTVNGEELDDFSYRKSCVLLIRYNLLQRTEKVGDYWPGVTMHKLVQWKLVHRA